MKKRWRKKILIITIVLIILILLAGYFILSHYIQDVQSKAYSNPAHFVYNQSTHPAIQISSSNMLSPILFAKNPDLKSSGSTQGNLSSPDYLVNRG